MMTRYLKYEHFHPDSNVELIVLRDIRRFLDAFDAFDQEATKIEETLKLKTLLTNTTNILSLMKIKIDGEPSIYNPVKSIIGLYYPSTQIKPNRASFISQFKTYNPDILIPELSTAIEYKYIRSGSTKKTVDDFIDEIRIDSVNYKGDSSYKKFYAVIYIEDSAIGTPEQIRECWRHKRFPNNWELILAFK